MSRIIMIDNQDSFTYNLVDALRQLQHQVVVLRNTVSVATLNNELSKADVPTLICLSPGPGSPQTAGHLLELLDAVRNQYPVLGICLGLQALLNINGIDIVRCPVAMHGKATAVTTQPHAIFAGLPNPLNIARYHSLQGAGVPQNAKLLAASQEDPHNPEQLIPMAVEFSSPRAIGLQFHPESILTAHGAQLLAQTVQYLLSMES